MGYRTAWISVMSRFRLASPFSLFLGICLMVLPVRADLDVESAERVLVKLHHAASQGDGDTYFSLFTEDAIFIGTDASERWTITDFKAYAMPYFSAGRGWTYRKTERHINVSAAGTHASFDEILNNEHFGVCRGTGVLRAVEGEWKIEQYHLTIPLPNKIAHEVAAAIHALEIREQTVLLRESFDHPQLPELFTVGMGQWNIVGHYLQGRQLAADNHTAFRKIYLDHQDVEYAYELKLDGEAFHQLLINWGLAHIAKVVIRYDGISIIKIREEKKRLQMKELGHDQGLDPLDGDWSEPNRTLAQAPLQLNPDQWYQVVVRMVNDQISATIDGTTIIGTHPGITEKKDNFGFQAGGLEGTASFDNIEVINLR